MTLTSSGTLDYNSIRAEFGSPSSNVYLNLYYRGGPYTYNVPANANITTSSTGQLSVSNFYGTKNTTDYAKMSGGSYNSGGKSPIIYRGVGGPSLPSGFADGSIKVGSSSYTISLCYSTSSSQTVMQFSGGYGDSQFRLRPFYFYNTSGSNVGTFRTGHKAGYTGSPDIWQAPNPSHYYSQSMDNALAGPAPAGSQNSPGGTAGWIGGDYTILAQTLVIKAF